MAEEIDLVLVAMDSSDESDTAAEYAMAIAERYDADLHLLHVVDQRLKEAIEVGDLAAETVASHHQDRTASILDRLPDTVTLSRSSVVGYSTDRLGQTPGSVTLDAADELGADFLVIPRVSPSDDINNVLGKAALNVLEYASQPVLSV